jgi:hypothetical protein
VWIVASEGSAASSKAEPETRAKPRTMRKRAVKAPVIVRFKPTYITDLHDVPWPYNIWYRTR